MLTPVQAQKPLPLGGLAGDALHLWDADLAGIDKLLTDSGFIDILAASARRNAPEAAKRGRRSLALNRLLRTATLKHLKNWSFRTLFKEMQRNLDYRSFTQVFESKTRSAAAFSRNIARVDAATVRELNEHLCVLAQQRGVIQGRKYRQDTTVCETHIHHPTDSGLLQDGVRVLQRVVGRAEKLLPSLGKLRDRSKSVRNRVLEIHRAAKGKGEPARDRRERSYRKLLRIVRPVVTAASAAVERLGDGRATRHLDFMGQLAADGLRAELKTMVPRVEQVIRQTRARIVRGNNHYPDKLLSLFVPKTSVIRKGKAHKPSEFGRLVDLVEVEGGFVSDYRVLDGNPDDGSLLIPALRRHQRRFGRAPHTAATDRGFWSAKNERDAYEFGVKRVSIPTTGRLSAARLRLQRSRWFRRAQRWRANGEGRIGTLKNVYGMDRCMYKGDEAMERWIGWCVFANNLVVITRALRARQDDDDETPGTTQGQGCSAAA
jgi:IS5 family transposase